MKFFYGTGQGFPRILLAGPFRSVTQVSTFETLLYFGRELRHTMYNIS
jgi:hypothetical protein